MVIGRRRMLNHLHAARRWLKGQASRLCQTRLLFCLLAATALAAGLSPSWGADGEGTPLALGWVKSDGTSEVVEFSGEQSLEAEILRETTLGAPYEPLGHRLVRLTNARRVSRGLSPLKVSSELQQAAKFHSNWMANHDCFAHKCSGEPDWVTRIQNAGYLNYVLLAENIAAGYSSASAVVDAWMDSPGHRANMLNAGLREAGGGYAYSQTAYYHRYWTLDFGARNDAQGDAVYPVVINNEAWSTTALDVNLYVYGEGWATEMRFRNEGGAWSNWQPFRCTKAWTLSAEKGSPAVVYAQVRAGSTIVESSDIIHIPVPPVVSPSYMLFLSEQGSTPTAPVEYHMTIDAQSSWNASADQGWIKLSDTSGPSGSSVVSVHLDGFPTNVGSYVGTITVESLGMPVDVAVVLAVSGGSLQQSHVPLLSREQD
jgi:hypothetical protein